MKALTLTQPWASLVAIGAKRIETRSWATNYRGPLAIHAAKGFPKWARDFTLEPVCYETMRTLGYKTRGWFPAYPVGAVIATCKLVDCVEMRELRYGLDGQPVGIIGKYTDMLAERTNEREFGDYSYGRYAWILGGVECFEHPIPATGHLGLWEWALV
jgi:hypothetical protein